MATPHNSAKNGDFAKTVLMPGDPLRAKWIADNFLENARLVNDVRGVQGYTGKYKGVEVSVMASGMGCPSMGIYSHELFSYYDVERIIRVGSVGAMRKELKLKDIILAQGACTNSNFLNQFSLNGNIAPTADFETLKTAYECANELGIPAKVGCVLTSDTFYDASNSTLEWAKMGVLGVEMETAALYANAAYLGKKALSILSVSDSLVSSEELSAEERQTSFNNMIVLALECAIRQ